MVLLIQPPGSTAHVLRIPVISARTEFLVLTHWYFIVYIVVLYVYCKVMYRIQHSDRYPPLLRVSPRGLRGLPVADECSSDPETWCARCLTLMGTGRTKFHVLNRIFLEPAGCAPLRSLYNSNIQYRGTRASCLASA